MIKFYEKCDPYYEFSNYYKAPQVIDGITYTCNEQYYQSMKFIHYPEYRSIIMEADSPQKIKSLGAQRPYFRGGRWKINKLTNHRFLNDVINEYKDKVHVRSDWESVKDDIMYKGLKAKFTQNTKLRELLLNTNNVIIIENSPKDYYWGIGKDGTGKNTLGNMLYRLRDELRKK